MAFGILLRRQGFQCSQLGHVAKVETTTTSTCVTAGNIEWKCNFCGESGSEQGVTNPNNHEGSQKNIATENCCYKWTCCGKEESSHTPEWGGTADIHVKCSTCGYVISTTHVYVYDETLKSPTCSEEGLKLRKCLDCGYSYTEPIEKLPHTPGDPATCTMDQTCTQCGAVIESKTGHTPGDPATCLTNQVCTTCQTVLTYALGHIDSDDNGKCDRCGVDYCDSHNYIIIPEVPATCITTGQTSYEACSICGHRLTEPDIIPASNHTWSDWQINNEDNMMHMRFCTVCDASESGTCEIGNCETYPDDEYTHIAKCSLCSHEYQFNLMYTGVRGDSLNHWFRCEHCGEEYLFDCVIEIDKDDVIGDPRTSTTPMHRIRCSLCGRNEYQVCSSNYACYDSSDGKTYYWNSWSTTQHSWQCDKCEHLWIEDCTTYTDTGCIKCGNDCNHPGESYVSACAGTFHNVYCTKCGTFLRQEDCTLLYSNSDSAALTHTEWCTVCDYYQNDHACRFTGMDATGISECPCGVEATKCDRFGHNYTENVISCDGHFRICEWCADSYPCGGTVIEGCSNSEGRVEWHCSCGYSGFD